jgi:nicotinate-nucleotide adenylyltransferase
VRLGLFGGTFDPIHRGHLEMAQAALQMAHLDAVHFVTSVNPPHKSEQIQANFLDRHAMVALALARNPRLIPSSLEYDRAGKSYSIDTVLRFQKATGPSNQFFFLIGMDSFLDLPTWKEYRRFPELCSFLVFSRPGYDEKELDRRLPEEFRLKVFNPSARGHLTCAAQGGFFVVRDFANPISSTQIRERVRARQPIRNWVPPEVEEYISKTELYLT